MNLHAVMDSLHDSGIECGMQSLRDNNWEAWIGNDVSGRAAEEAGLSLDEVAAWLDWKARALYPRSHHAQTPPEEGVAASIEGTLVARERVSGLGRS